MRGGEKGEDGGKKCVFFSLAKIAKFFSQTPGDTYMTRFLVLLSLFWCNFYYFMLLFGFGMTPETIHPIGPFVGVEWPTSLAVARLALECATVYVAEN
jgi:hypothetical protein